MDDKLKKLQLTANAILTLVTILVIWVGTDRISESLEKEGIARWIASPAAFAFTVVIVIAVFNITNRNSN